MVCCSAFGCSNRSDRKKRSDGQEDAELKITFHKFPRNKELREKWIKALRRRDWQPSDASVVCSQHFEETCFDRTSINVTRLHKDAVPTIFSAFPKYLQQTIPKKRTTLKRKLTAIAEEIPQELCDVPQPGTSSTSSSTEVHENIALKSLPMKYLVSRTTSFSPDRRHQIESPRILSMRQTMQHKAEQYRKKMRLLQQNKRRQIKKITKMTNIISSLQKRNFILEENLNVLCNISGPNQYILRRQVAKSQKRLPKAYSPELRKFALTLHYYSPRAYNYVRESFDTCLPHPKTLSRWYKSIDGKPGFTAESFVAIKQMAEKSSYPLLCGLLIDEVAIRKHLDHDGKETVGYVDMGSELVGDDRAMAKEAFVFMLVCINSFWKIPMGYFLADGVNGEQKCNLVKQCLSLVHDAGVRVLSLTCDGAASNITMATNLGCHLNPLLQNFTTQFHHPVTSENVYFFLDPCHMIKLIRNTLGEMGLIIDGNGDVISWEYIKKLHEIQESEGLHLANKIRALHINFAKQKMKVRLATQVLSKSVADALTFCSEAMKLSDFQGCEATIHFIKIFNDLFDIFNSKSIKQCGFRKPLHRENYSEIMNCLNSAVNYILNLRVNRVGDLVIKSNRKTGFLGFLICIRSLKNMYSEICEEKELLMYIPTYKISQDHLELFFAVIRAHGGSNNNPTCKQFMSAYKKNVVHLELKAVDSGNCIPLENISILHSTALTSVERLNLTTPTYRLQDDIHINIEDDTDHLYLNSIQELTLVAENIIRYIAGFVVRYLYKSLHCEECLGVLIDETKKEMCQLTAIKDQGGLIYPSSGVIDICKVCEKCVRQALLESGGKILLKKFTPLKLSLNVLQYYLGKPVFTELNEHILNQSPLDNHVLLLIKAISLKYLTIRFNYICKRATDTSDSKRQLFNKMILFKGH